MKKVEYTRLSRPEDEGGGIHIAGLIKGRSAAPNGKPFDALTDDEVDEILAGPEPKSNSRFAAHYD